jgi:hypothetical protein
VPRVITNLTFVLDQMGHTVRGPQATLIAEVLRPTLEPAFNLLYVLRTKSWLTARATGSLQPLASVLSQLGRPLTHRLAMRAHLPGYF